MFSDASRELVRAVRGGHRQLALSAALGFRSNPIADWEHGRRFPTAAGFASLCTIVGIDLENAVARFDPPTPLRGRSRDDISDWLERLRGATSIGVLAERTGVSRFSVSRWLSGESQPRLPQFLGLIDAITGRVADLVALLVSIDQVPSLSSDFDARRRSKEIAWKHPWTEALLRAMETAAYMSQAHDSAWLGAWLGRPGVEIDRLVDELVQCRLIHWNGDRYELLGSMTVTTRGEKLQYVRHKSRWAQELALRLQSDVSDENLSAYNVFSCSRSEYEQVHQILRSAYREIRTLLTDGDKETEVAMLSIQCVCLPRPEPPLVREASGRT